MTRYEKIKEAIESMSDSEIVYLYNDYCDAAHYEDCQVYTMDDLDEIMYSTKPWEVLRMAFYGDFRPCDNYFYFNGCGNLESFDYADSGNSPIDVGDIAAWIDDNEDALNNDDIQEILDEWEDEDEEDEDNENEEEDEDGED